MSSRAEDAEAMRGQARRLRKIAALSQTPLTARLLKMAEELETLANDLSGEPKSN
jgi:hypothetical protein